MKLAGQTLLFLLIYLIQNGNEGFHTLLKKLLSSFLWLQALFKLGPQNKSLRPIFLTFLAHFFFGLASLQNFLWDHMAPGSSRHVFPVFFQAKRILELPISL